jgi:hypothetical protein
MGSAAIFQAKAQGFDPIQKASGWSRADSDGSCTFFDPGTQALQTWMRDGGITGSLDVSKAGLSPERWVLDSQGNAWLVAGTALQWVDKNGKPGRRETLPMEVGDLAWDAKGFILCYRSREPYLEKRDYKSGSVIWSYGSKPQKGDGAARAVHRIAVSEEGNVLLGSGPSLTFTQIDGQKGKLLGQVVFSHEGNAAPSLALGDADRPALAWWVGHTAGFMGVPGSQVASVKMQGLLLARLDTSKGLLTFHPTGVSENHVLLGVTDSEAILRAPAGGLAFVALP